MNRYLLFLTYIILFSVLVSCRATKELGFKKVKPMSVKKLQNNVESNYIDYDTFSAKISVKVATKEKQTSFKANLRVKRDSMIWISISPALGVEVARIQLTPDSVKFLNRLQSEYFTGDYAFLRKNFYLDIDFYSLQAIISNELFTYPNTPDTAKFNKYFKSSVDSGLYCLQTMKDRKIKRHIKKNLKKNKTNELISQDIYIHPFKFKIDKVYVEDFENDRSLKINYKDFEAVDDGADYPRKAAIHIENKDNATDISMKYSKVAINKDLKFNFKISSKYEKIKH